MEIREIWFDVFTDKLHTLRQAGFVHRDLLRPSNLPGGRYNNILLTSKAYAWLMWAFPCCSGKPATSFFRAYVQRELEELALFRKFFLGR